MRKIQIRNDEASLSSAMVSKARRAVSWAKIFGVLAHGGHAVKKRAQRPFQRGIELGKGLPVATAGPFDQRGFGGNRHSF